MIRRQNAKRYGYDNRAHKGNEQAKHNRRKRMPK
jgi:hypothetical protein